MTVSMETQSEFSGNPILNKTATIRESNDSIIQYYLIENDETIEMYCKGTNLQKPQKVSINSLKKLRKTFLNLLLCSLFDFKNEKIGNANFYHFFSFFYSQTMLVSNCAHTNTYNSEFNKARIVSKTIDCIENASKRHSYFLYTRR